MLRLMENTCLICEGYFADVYCYTFTIRRVEPFDVSFSVCFCVLCLLLFVDVDLHFNLISQAFFCVFSDGGIAFIL